jgi:hypothetical protein
MSLILTKTIHDRGYQAFTINRSEKIAVISRARLRTAIEANIYWIIKKLL